MTDSTRKAYQETLPKKRLSSGAIFLDQQGRVLIVKPTYKENWEIPGGAVDRGESPLQACIREVKEELGLGRRPLRLLCVDYSPETAGRTESLNFIFYGGVLSAGDVAAIRLPADELSAYRFVEPEEAGTLLNRRLGRRVRRALRALTGGALYLESQKPVLAEDRGGRRPKR